MNGINSVQQLTTSVYRKPTHTDQYIHHHSNHHPQIKRAIIATLVRRAKSICSPSNLQSELNHLKTTFITLNGYPRQLVESTIKSTLQPSEQSRPKPEPSPITVNIPYVGPLSHQISRLLKKTASIDTTFTSGRTLKTLLKANGKGCCSITPNPSGCVYQLKCNCGDRYIGETGRPIATRIKEHQTSVKNSDLKSALSEHLIKNPDHTINWQHMEILAVNINYWRKRKLMEAIMIKRSKPELNRDLGVFLPNTWFINKQ